VTLRIVCEIVWSLKSLWILKKSCVIVPGLFVEKFVDFEKRVGGFCGDFCCDSDDFEVIVIVNKTSFLVELDDCYCCAC